MKLLAIGDIVGEPGVAAIERTLKKIKTEHKIDFTVANGENSANSGISAKLAERMFMAGVDVITLGNHTWDKREIGPYLEENQYILRPHNMSDVAPGRGFAIYPAGLKNICVISLIGRCTMNFGPDNPFLCVSKIIKEIKNNCDFIVVDFHANATSEKKAMGYYLDGQVSAVWGTHTHVQTADEEIFENGTGYITDIGMTGPRRSVIGIKPENSIRLFLCDIPERYVVPDGDCVIDCAVFDIDDNTKKCTSVTRLREVCGFE